MAFRCQVEVVQINTQKTKNSLKTVTMSIETLNPRTSNDLAAGYLLWMLSQGSKTREQPSRTEGLCLSDKTLSFSTAVPQCHTGPLHRRPQMVEQEDENQFLYRDTTGSLPRQQHVVADSEIFPSSIMSSIEIVPTSNVPRVCSPGPHEVVSTHNSDKTFLPKWFKESTTTVVIGKGHLPRKTAGNIFLRRMVQNRLRDYQDTNRRGRAVIVSDIYHRLTCLNPKGRCFGNFDPMGIWVEAQEHSARDKIAATFRDCLSHLYKSSTQNKVAKRRTRKAEK
jgi:hypothetical protein